MHILDTICGALQKGQALFYLWLVQIEDNIEHHENQSLLFSVIRLSDVLCLLVELYCKSKAEALSGSKYCIENSVI